MSETDEREESYHDGGGDGDMTPQRASPDGLSNTERTPIILSSSRWLAARETPEPPTVLEPEHPLMQKFQEALRQYLLKENDRVYTEILELKTNLKQNKRKYATQMSQEIYSLEQEVQQQRNTIRQYEETLQTVVKLREERENALIESRELYKKQTEKLDSKKREDMELLGELDALNLLCKQYESWQNETDCDLAVNKRVSEKITVEKQQLALKQKELDTMMYKLTTEVWELEGKLALLGEQWAHKEREREAVGARTADGGAALAALRAEHARLLRAWGAVLTLVQHRDSLHTQLTQEYTDLQSDYRVLNAELEGIKREISEAMQTHENMTVEKDRMAYDLAICQKSIKSEEKKRDNLENSVRDTQTAIDITEKELQKAKMDNLGLTSSLKVILREIEKLTEAKVKLEWETLEQLQERMCNDKATQTTATAIRKLKDDARKMEMTLLSGENQQARMSLQIEQLKERNMKEAEITDEERKVAEAKEAEVGALEDVLKDTLLQIDRKQCSLEAANKKVSLLLEQLMGVEKTPSQRRVEELEKNIADSSVQIRELQQDWLRAQGRVVELSQQRQEQASQISLTRKQIQILENKNTKLENEIAQLGREEATIQRCVDGLQARVDQLYQQHSDNSRLAQELEAAYGHLTLDYMAQLKDSEEETSKLEEEISELEEEKEQLATDLHKIKKEAMSWQKMVILAMETKQNIMAEKGTGSETEKMKLEIHRMQVRQAQLSRLGARLAEELARGVCRREGAQARAISDPRRRRIALPLSLRDKRADIRRVKQEIETNNSMINTLMKDEEFQQMELNEKVQAISEVERQISDIKEELEEAQLTKQTNLEKLIGCQRRAQRWAGAAAGRSPPALAPGELARQEHSRRALRCVALALRPTHPSLRPLLARALAALGPAGREGEREEERESAHGDCPHQS